MFESAINLLILPSRAEIDTFEIARSWLAWSLIVATAIVWFGVYLEREKFSKETQNIGWKVLLAGLGAEVLLSAFLWSVDTGISNKLRSELLEVRQRTANRDITPDEMKDTSAKLTRFSGQPAKIVIFPVNFESAWIADAVYGILLNAHWDVSFPARLSAPPGNGFMVQGIFIDRSNDDASKEAATALREALNSTVAQAGVAGTGNSVSGAFDPTKPLVWIFIGGKPTPLRSWVKP
jgi:hypothetical protein